MDNTQIIQSLEDRIEELESFKHTVIHYFPILGIGCVTTNGKQRKQLEEIYKKRQQLDDETLKILGR